MNVTIELDKYTSSSPIALLRQWLTPATMKKLEAGPFAKWPATERHCLYLIMHTSDLLITEEGIFAEKVLLSALGIWDQTSNKGYRERFNYFIHALVDGLMESVTYNVSGKNSKSSEVLWDQYDCGLVEFLVSNDIKEVDIQRVSFSAAHEVHEQERIKKLRIMFAGKMFDRRDLNALDLMPLPQHLAYGVGERWQMQ